MNMPAKHIFSLRMIALLLATALLACRLAESALEPDAAPTVIVGPSATAPPEVPSPPIDNIVYTETFNGPTVSGWTMAPVNDAFAQVQRDQFDGAYRWRMTAMQGVFSWTYPDLPITLPSPDFYYAVTVRLGNAPADIAYGPLFGVRDGNNLYYFKVSGLGEYALYTRIDGEFSALIDESATMDIATGAHAINRLAVERSQGMVRLYANGNLLAEMPLPGASGTIGLAAELLAGQSAMLFFDDVHLCRARCP